MVTQSVFLAALILTGFCVFVSSLTSHGCNEELKGTKDEGYRGCQSFTWSGRECQKWTVQAPHKHSRTPSNMKGKGLGDHNLCRNPDGENTIWCYTTDPSKRWEYCSPICDEQTSAAKGVDYRGCQRFTVKGLACQRWESQEPHRHGNTPSARPSAGLEHNYCRNPDGEPNIWCYTMDKEKRWDYCQPYHQTIPIKSSHSSASHVELKKEASDLIKDEFHSDDYRTPGGDWQWVNSDKKEFTAAGKKYYRYELLGRNDCIQEHFACWHISIHVHSERDRANDKIYAFDEFGYEGAKQHFGEGNWNFDLVGNARLERPQ